MLQRCGSYCGSGLSLRFARGYGSMSGFNNQFVIRNNPGFCGRWVCKCTTCTALALHIDMKILHVKRADCYLRHPPANEGATSRTYVLAGPGVAMNRVMPALARIFGQSPSTLPDPG